MFILPKQKEFFDLATNELLRRQRILWSALLCAFLNLADMVMSLHLFSQFEGLEEANPILKAALSLSEGHFILLKMTLGNVGIVTLYVFARKGHKLAERGLYFVTAVIWLVVFISLIGLYCLSHQAVAASSWILPVR